jgi:glutamine cyclotransferase
VWANLWPTETIVRIDAESAVIKGWIDMRGLRDAALNLAKKTVSSLFFFFHAYVASDEVGSVTVLLLPLLRDPH